MTLTPDQIAEIEKLKDDANFNETRRPTVSALEDLLFTAFPVLDHGIIRVIDYMGDEAAVVQAARVSYGKGTRKLSEDIAVIRYLMRHWHSTPFEMCEIKFHVKLPIFVARQWIRHRTASVNEYSARYSIMDKEFYIPEPLQLASQSFSNKQGRGAVIKPEDAARVLMLLKQDAEQTYTHYEEMLDEDGIGLARELARMNLTLNTYTQWYWKTDLHNLFNFLRLRADSHAQYEIRVYADIIMDIVKAWVPSCYQAFMDYRHEAVTLSKQQFELLKSVVGLSILSTQLLAQAKPEEMSKREFDDLINLFKTKEQ